ncbi:thioredoxin-like protein [Obelidium mucronatum]|nr:thioredoxin-like protein [Obelidium mucronatum]
MVQETLRHQSLLPGQQFPLVTASLVGSADKQPLFTPNNENGESTLIVIYRGAFCPYCAKQIKHLQETFEKLKSAKINLIVASCRLATRSRKIRSRYGYFRFPVAYGLGIEEMRELGVYVSNPTHYIEQEHVFSEPAWFLVEPDGAIKYLEYASAPFGGRVDADLLVGIYSWARDKGRKVTWGQVV